jgi:dihydrofolate reductase
MHTIILVAVLGKETRAIGLDNKLLWRIPPDMARFVEITTGHPVIMGRKTWESIPEKFRPLSHRTNIVISSDRMYVARGAVTTTSLTGGIEVGKNMPGMEKIFIIGGGKVYEEALPLADQLNLTEVDSPAEGDVFFPPYKDVFTRVTFEESHEHNGLTFTYRNLERE